MIRACGRTSQSGTLVRHQYDVAVEGTYDGTTPLVRVDTTCCDSSDVRILGLSRTVIESVSWIIVWTYHGQPAGMSLSVFSASSFTNLKIIRGLENRVLQDFRRLRPCLWMVMMKVMMVMGPNHDSSDDDGGDDDDDDDVDATG